MECLCQSSRVETPASAARRILMICSSEKTLPHEDVLMWFMKTLLTSGCINQRGAGQHNILMDKFKLYFTNNK